MKTDENMKKITELKELLEIIKNKFDHMDIRQTAQSATISLMKDQMSVVNSKLDKVDDKLEGMEDKLGSMEDKLDDMSDTLDAHTGSLITIEKELKGYADMYKINDSNIRRMEKRLETIEENTDIDVNPDYQLQPLSETV